MKFPVHRLCTITRSNIEFAKATAAHDVKVDDAAILAEHVTGRPPRGRVIERCARLMQPKPLKESHEQV